MACSSACAFGLFPHWERKQKQETAALRLLCQFILKNLLQVKVVWEPFLWPLCVSNAALLMSTFLTSFVSCNRPSSGPNKPQGSQNQWWTEWSRPPTESTEDGLMAPEVPLGDSDLFLFFIWPYSPYLIADNLEAFFQRLVFFIAFLHILFLTKQTVSFIWRMWLHEITFVEVVCTGFT